MAPSHEAEAYELSTPPGSPSTSHAGPSSRPHHSRTNSNPASTSSRRTLTLHTGASTVLFSSTIPSPRRRASSLQQPVSPVITTGTPRLGGRGTSFLLHEESGEVEETVEVPDFSGFLGLNAEKDDNFEIAKGMKNGFKRRLFLLLEEPASSPDAFLVHITVTCAILFSALLTVLSTLPSFHTQKASVRALFGLDTTVVVIFTIEYLLRAFAHSDSWKMLWNWSTTFFAVIDLLAIFPYYIELMLKQDTTILFRFSILRTFRLLRVFRAFKYQSQILFTIEAMYVATHRSKDALLALSFFIGMALVVFSTLIYFAERGTWSETLGGFVNADGDPSQFESIPSAAWFVLVTITTVGYGEIIPRSALGKLLTVPLLVFGLLLIALPSFVLGRNFAIVFDAMQSQAVRAAASSQTPRQSFETPISGQPLAQDSGQGYAYDGLGVVEQQDVGGATAVGGKEEGRDLTNKKLAMNQQVLLDRLDELAGVTERQGAMLQSILQHLGNNKDNGDRMTGAT